MTLLQPWRFKLLGYDAGFEHPAALLLILVGIGLGILGLVLALARRDRVAKLVSERFVGLLAPGVSVARPLLQSALYGAGLVLFALALSQPQCGSHTELVKRQGIDVVVALDASKSMLARDVQPSRIERARLELTTLLDELKGDRVGIVIFAGDAFIQCPLTTDYSAAKLFLRAVDPLDMPQGGTDIGGALALGRQVLENAGGTARDRVVVLLSDGEDFRNDVDAAVQGLKEAKVRVYAVGIGSESGEPIPELNKNGEVVGYKRDGAGATVLTRLNSSALQRISEATGGEYFHQPRGVAMADVISRIDRLQKAEFESRMTVHYEQRYQWFALPGFLLLVFAMLIRPSRRKAAPA